MYDYVIVGAGSAGCVLAGRLSEDPECRVLLLEAGPPDKKLEIRIPAAFNKLFKTKYDWAYETEPQAEPRRARDVLAPREDARRELVAQRADVRARQRARLRPLGRPRQQGMGVRRRAPLLRAIRAVRARHRAERGTSGPLNIADLRDPNPTTIAFLEAAEQAGVPRSKDINGPEQDGIDTTQVTQKRGRRWSAADAYLKPARKQRATSRSSRARTRCGSSSTARARRASSTSPTARRSESRRTRCSCPVARSTRRSCSCCRGSVRPISSRRLGIPVVADLPGVGKNLQDHLAIMDIVHSKEPVTLAAAESIRNLGRFLTLGRGMLTSNVGEACGFVRTRPDLDAPDLELIFAPVPFIDHGLESAPGPRDHDRLGRVTPRSMGELTLRSADPFAAPRIEPNYLSDPDGEDLRVLVEGSKLARRIFDAPPLARYVGEPILPAGAADHRRRSRRAHPSRLADAVPPRGYLQDGHRRPRRRRSRAAGHGIDNLRVVDASVMPVIPRGHTHASTVMIAEKAVDLIRD